MTLSGNPIFCLILKVVLWVLKGFYRSSGVFSEVFQCCAGVLVGVGQGV